MTILIDLTKMRFKIAIFTMLLLLNISVFAQTDIEKMELMRQCSLQQVIKLNDYISFLLDQSKDINSRSQYIESALSLFIGRGDPYEMEGVLNSGVKMTITSPHSKKTSSCMMKDYLSRLVKLPYSKVDIQSTEVFNIEVSNLKKLDDNKYLCTVCFEQIFVGYRDDIPMFTDKTRKKVEVYILAEETIDGQEFIVLLGDVTALEIS